MSALPTDRAWIELDMESLRRNVEILQGLMPEGCRLMPAVKANAYGHGAVEVARELNALGVDAFCVATAAEGAELRESGIRGTILVLGYTHPGSFCLLRKYRLTQTVLDSEYGRELSRYGYEIHVHIGIDTGMHRLGERCENIGRIIDIFRCKNLVVDGMYTHLCAADSGDPHCKAYTKMQVEAFFELTERIKEAGFNCPELHIQSSYGLINYPEIKCDYVRVGIALYGLLSTGEDTEKCGLGLSPVLSLKARVSSVKKLEAGESCGYGLQFTAPCDMKIAVISIGYADGIPRSLSCGRGYVLIDGKKASVIGRICMDQISVDVTDIPYVKRGDIAVVVGKSEEAEISACELAEGAGTITNEILSRLGGRLKRVCV